MKFEQRKYGPCSKVKNSLSTVRVELHNDNGDLTTVRRQLSLVNGGSTTVRRQLPLVNGDSTTVRRQLSLVNGGSTTVRRQLSLVNGGSTTVRRQLSLVNRGLTTFQCSEIPIKNSYYYKMMNSLTLSRRAQVSEISAIASRLDTLLSKKWSKSDDYLTNATSEFHTLTVRMTESMNLRVLSDYADLDRSRRDSLRSLFLFLHSFRKSPESEAKANALTVLEVFNRYGTRMLKKGVDGLTGLINALLADLASDEAQAAIALVPGLTERIEALRNAAQAFSASRLDYQQRRSALSNIEKTRELKRAIEDRINTVFLPYFAMKSKSEGGEFTTLYQNLVEMVTEANSLVKLRREMAKARREGKNQKESA